jgi:GT2 family glycosyltransferase
MPLQSQPKVSIIVLPHERYNIALQSLDSIFEYTREPFNLIYVDVNSPPYVYEGLKERHEKHNFTWIRKDYFIQPNVARNLAIEHVTTPYFVFIDNDVIVTDGWLETLVKCAEETGAWLVGPLIIESDGKNKTQIHAASCELKLDEARGAIRHSMNNHQENIENLSITERCPSELLEYHCILIKTEGLQAIGGKVDEGMINTRSHMDLCFEIKKAGGTIYFEPECRVVYMRYTLLKDKHDEAYIKFHYNDEDTLKTISYFENKWNVKVESNRFKIVSQKKYQHLKLYKRILHKIGLTWVI